MFAYVNGVRLFFGVRVAASFPMVEPVRSEALRHPDARRRVLIVYWRPLQHPSVSR
jgi:hypothetical protein